LNNWFYRSPRIILFN